MPDNGAVINERLNALDREVERLRARTHEFGNKLTEHEGDIEGIVRTLDRIETTMNSRFDKQIATVWRAAGLLLAAIAAAAAVASQFT